LGDRFVVSLHVGRTGDIRLPGGPTCYGGVGGVLAEEVPAGQDAEGHAVEAGLSYSISGLG
jgi:hypothetical protein